MYNKGLFHDWVPKPVQLLLLIIMMAVAMPIGGVYTGNLSHMVSGSGVMQEYFLMANYATTIGMGVAMPLVLRLKLRFKIKHKVTAVFIILAFLLFVNATTSEPWVIIISSLLIGFLKMIISMEFFLPLMMLVPVRGVFYGLLYGLVLVMAQVMNFYAVEYSVLYNWQYFFIVTALVCLLMALISWVLMHNQYFALKMPLYYIDWLSGLLFATSFLSLAYVLSFGRQQDWFNSPNIMNGCILFFVTFAALAIRQLTLKRPYLSFRIFKKNNVRHGLLMLFFLGMFMALGSIQSIFAIGILQYDQITNAKLNLLMIPGIVAGAVVAIIWFKKELNVQMYIFSGFAAMVMFTIVLYLSMVPEFNYERWYLPMFLKGYGMCALFIAIWYYTLDKLDVTDLLPAIGFVLVWRTFIAVGIFSALFSWVQYRFQVTSLGDLAVYWDGLLLGPQETMMNLKSIQINAILAANKKLLGYVIIAGIGVLLYILAHHFGRQRFTKVKLIRTLKGKALIAKRRKREQLIINKNLKGIKDIAGSAP